MPRRFNDDGELRSIQSHFQDQNALKVRIKTQHLPAAPDLRPQIRRLGGFLTAKVGFLELRTELQHTSHKVILVAEVVHRNEHGRESFGVPIAYRTNGELAPSTQ